MRHCTECGTEYRTALTTCPDCGVKLKDGPLPTPASRPLVRSVRLTSVSDPTAGDIIRALLSAEGIPAFVRRHGPITGELGLVTDGMTDDYAIIMVPEDRLEEARRLLSELESGVFEWPEGMAPDDAIASDEAR